MHVVFLGVSIVLLIDTIISIVKIILFKDLLVWETLLIYGIYGIMIGFWISIFIEGLKEIIKKG